MTSILTPINLQGFLGVETSSYSVRPLWRYHNTQTASKVGTENFNGGNPSQLMTSRSHNPLSHSAKMDFSPFFPQGAH